MYLEVNVSKKRQPKKCGKIDFGPAGSSGILYEQS